MQSAMKKLMFMRNSCAGQLAAGWDMWIEPAERWHENGRVVKLPDATVENGEMDE
jgi:hypothetical protein